MNMKYIYDQSLIDYEYSSLVVLIQLIFELKKLSLASSDLDDLTI